jgi:hypothetical protein
MYWIPEFLISDLSKPNFPGGTMTKPKSAPNPRASTMAKEFTQVKFFFNFYLSSVAEMLCSKVRKWANSLH